MPVCKVQIDEFREQILSFFLNPDSSKVYLLGQSLETDSDIVKNCVIPETLFHMQHTWLGSRFSHNLMNGSPVDVNSDVVFTTYHANANHQPAYQMHIVDDVASLMFAIRQKFVAFQVSRKEVWPNFEHERQEREAVYIFWRVDANDLEIGSPSIFPEEVTNNCAPGYGPPLGENWPNSHDEQAEVPVPETPEQSMPTNQALPTTPILRGSSDRTRFPQAPRRNRTEEASRRISFEEETWDFWFFSS